MRERTHESNMHVKDVINSMTVTLYTHIVTRLRLTQ